ncbi:helix-turn-helix domain-containing protein [bacterium]|nr:helix-turn-helix domain-containing protein [bacterium]
MEFFVANASQLGPVLQGWRKKKKLTQTELGARVGLSQFAVSALENAPEKAAVERLFRLLSALEVEVVLRERQTAPLREEEW